MTQNYKAPRLTLPVGERDHFEGPHDATMVLVEYGDYQCPYCGAAYPIVKRIQKELGTRLKFVFRNFPLTNSHPQAQWAAEMAELAAAQGKFWEMHDYLYENQRSLGDEGFFVRYAKRAQNRCHQAGTRDRTAHPLAEGAGRLHERHQERSQRDANFLHQWCEIRRLS